MFSNLYLVIWLGVLYSGEALHANDPSEVVEDLSVEITETNWNNIFEENTKQLLIAEFYSPLCGFCKAFAPEYIKLGHMLSGVALLTKTAVESNRALFDRFNVTSVPTLLMFQRKDDTNPIVHDGKKKADLVLEWVIASSPVFKIHHYNDLLEFLVPKHASPVKRQVLIYNSLKPPKQFSRKNDSFYATFYTTSDEFEGYQLPLLAVHHQNTTHYYPIETSTHFHELPKDGGILLSIILFCCFVFLIYLTFKSILKKKGGGKLNSTQYYPNTDLTSIIWTSNGKDD